MKGGPIDPARLGFGCVRLGSVSEGRPWRSDVRLVREAVDLGVSVFDTADAYGSGVSEQVLGRALRGRRSEVEIATKVGYLFNDRSLLGHSFRRTARPLVAALRRSGAGPSQSGMGGGSYRNQDFSTGYVRRAVDASLRRLDSDYIDLLQLHAPRDPLPEVMGEVERLIASGKIRRFGIGAESVASARAWLAIEGVAAVQVPFGVLDPQAADDLFPLATHSDVDIWVRGVLGGGLLAMVGVGGSQLTSDPKWPLIRDLSAIAQGAGVSLFRLAVDFVRSFPAVSTILLGIHSSAHLTDNVRMMAAPSVHSDLIDEASRVISRWLDDNEPI